MGPVMINFGKLIACLLCAIPVIGAVAAVVVAIQLVIFMFPVIIGLLVLGFLAYALVVGLVQIGRDKA